MAIAHKKEVINHIIKAGVAKPAKAPHGFWNKVADEVNDKYDTDLTCEQVRGLFKRYRDVPRVSTIKAEKSFVEKAASVISDKKRKPKDLSLEDFIDGFTTAQDFRRSFDISQIQYDKTIKTKKPIAVAWLTDWHIGSPYTDYGAILADVRFIKEHQGFYANLGGDACDNFMPGFKDAGAVMNQLHPATIQLLTEEKIIEYLEPKIIAKNGGNHDAMPSKKTGINTEYFILRDKSFGVMPFGGLINLTVGDVVYKILWKHSYRFKSSLNLFNSHRQMLQTLEPTADIVVQEHEHNPGIEVIERFEFESRKTVVNIRTGTYKISDPYSMTYYKSGRMGPQTVVLYPDRRKILAFHGEDALEDAGRYLDAA